MSELHVKLGELLQLERERQGISLDDVSGDLKIPEATLLKIEAGQVDALPAELYFKLFAKSYSEFLGIDYGKTTEAIREEIGEETEPAAPAEADHQAEQKATDRPDPEQNRAPGEIDLSAFIKRAGVLAGVIVAVFVIFWSAYKLFFTDASGPAADRAVTDEVTQATPETSEGETEETGSSPIGYDWDVPTYKPPDSIRLALAAREESWATVVADGDTLLYRNLVPGHGYEVAAKYRLLVSIGIPRVVDMTLDGQPAYLASAETGRVSRVEIDQTNRDQFGTPPQRRVDVSEVPEDAPADAPEPPESHGDSSETGPTNTDEGEV